MAATETKRVALVGPVLPFRGGISQDTTMLHRALSRQCNLITISFSRQYPAWLFPGESDRDESYRGHLEPGVDYLIDSVNPLSWHRAVRRIARHRPHYLLVPWWTVFWAPCLSYMLSALSRQGAKTLFLCHNVVDHESSVWKTFLTQRALRHGRAFIAHSRGDAALIKSMFGDNTEVLVKPPPVYSQFQRSGTEEPIARRAPVELLFFGFIRDYKGLDILLKALQLADRSDVFLRIVGEFWGKAERYTKLIEDYGLQDRVEVIGRYVPDDGVAAYFERADFVVLPYRSGTGSGVISLAYNFDKPVVVTDVGGLPDVVVEGETGFVVPPESPEQLADVLRRLDSSTAERMAPQIAQYKGTMTWDAFADAAIGMMR